MRDLYSEVSPSKNAHAAAVEALDWFQDFKTFGVMPASGGEDDQLSDWVDAIRAVSHANNELEAEEQRKQEEKANQQGKKGGSRG